LSPGWFAAAFMVSRKIDGWVLCDWGCGAGRGLAAQDPIGQIVMEVRIEIAVLLVRKSRCAVPRIGVVVRLVVAPPAAIPFPVEKNRRFVAGVINFGAIIGPPRVGTVGSDETDMPCPWTVGEKFGHRPCHWPMNRSSVLCVIPYSGGRFFPGTRQRKAADSACCVRERMVLPTKYNAGGSFSSSFWIKSVPPKG